jgi:hypothetical protein
MAKRNDFRFRVSIGSVDHDVDISGDHRLVDLEMVQNKRTRTTSIFRRVYFFDAGVVLVSVTNSESVVLVLGTAVRPVREIARLVLGRGNDNAVLLKISLRLPRI